jgi:hypothetical protein
MSAVARHRLLRGPQGEVNRDLDNALRRVPELAVLEFTRTYDEPMTVQFDHNPKGVLVVRIQEDATPETPIDILAPAAFTYTATGIRIDMIFGLEVGARYRFVLLVVG